MGIVGLIVLVVRADIADVREGEADRLPREARVGHHFLVAGHRGVEAQFRHRRALRPESLSPDHPPIGKDQGAGGPFRHVVGHGNGHREGGLLVTKSGDVAKPPPLGQCGGMVNRAPLF